MGLRHNITAAFVVAHVSELSNALNVSVLSTIEVKDGFGVGNERLLVSGFVSFVEETLAK